MAYTIGPNTSKPSLEIPEEIELNADATLKELFDLLEDYAPVWYTEQHRNRAAAALSRSGEYHLRPVESLPNALRAQYASCRKRT